MNLKRLVPLRWRRQARRQGYQGAEISERLLLDVQASLGRYRRDEIAVEQLLDETAEAAVLALFRLTLDSPAVNSGSTGTLAGTPKP